MTFGGATFDEERDGERLSTEMEAVKRVMFDGQWHTLPELHALTGYPSTAALDSRIRDLRKKKWGTHMVESKYVSRSVWAYRVLIPVDPRQLSLI